MPFTLAHPAAVLPFARHPFVVPALVAGSIAPDVPYFLRATGVRVSAQSWYEPLLNATTSHSWVGAVTVSLPIALALCALYAATLPVVANLRGPAAAGPRARPDPGRPWPVAGAWLVASALVGVATHLLWDRLVHEGGEAIAGALAPETLPGGLAPDRLLQAVSTVAGLLVLAVVLGRRVRDRGGPSRRDVALLAVVTAVAGVGGVIGATTVTRGRIGAPGLEAVATEAAKGAGAALLGATLLVVASWWLRRAVTPTARTTRR